MRPRGRDPGRHDGGISLPPIAGAVFDHVIANIVRSLARSPRTIKLVYMGPVSRRRSWRLGISAWSESASDAAAGRRSSNTVSLLEHDPNRDRSPARFEARS